jgi:hypothetical protein
VPEIGREEPVPDRWSAAAAPGLWVDEADDPRLTGEDLTDERSTLVDYLPPACGSAAGVASSAVGDCQRERP